MGELCLFSCLGKANHLGLIVGIPSLLTFVGGLLLYLRKIKRSYPNMDNGEHLDIPMRLTYVKSDSDTCNNTNVF